MNFDELADFIENRMRMSHVYQPLMLMALLRNGGTATVRDIAMSILTHDESQVEYYEEITKNMVGRVLTNRGVVVKDKAKRSYSLPRFDQLSDEDVKSLVDMCQRKLDEYTAKRGRRIWQHRKMSSGYISGTLRYEVLKRAKFRCELCGISADEKALEVDHIVPRNKGGSDDESNLQALCYSCNAMKQDRDDTDFRAVVASYQHREPGCIFCEVPPERVVMENRLAVALLDKYPVTLGHTLIIPKRHTSSYFGLGRPEVNACNDLLEALKAKTEEDDPTVDGFNMGTNSGNSAGQTIFHCHIHIIPRRSGDMQNPAGGVRHVIPERGHYTA